MLIYFILIGLIIIFGVLFEKNNKKLYSVLVFIILTLIAGLRSYVIGTDTLNYYTSFNEITNLFKNYGFSLFDVTRYEKGFVLLILLIRNFTTNYTIFFLIISSFINALICKFIREKSNNMCLSFLIFILSRNFFSEMNIMRQYIAIAIFLFSIKYIEQNKIIKYFVLILLASFIHKSAIILLPVYFLNKVEINKKEKISLVICTAIIYIFLYNILIRILTYFGMYQGYIETYIDSNKIGNILGFIMNAIIYIFIRFSTTNKDKINKSDKLLQNIFFIYLILSFLCIKISVLTRITEYFTPLKAVLIPNCAKNIKENNLRILSYIIIFICFCIYFGVIEYYRPSWNGCVPYKFFWEI